MSQEIINVGSAPNDGMGDPIRNAFIATNSNFAQLFALPNPTPPTTLTGKPGDVAGMYAYNSSYFYYCFGSYNGTTTIWAQVPQVNNVSGNSIGYGTSNVTIASSNANITVGVSGVGNVATFTTTGVTVSGSVTAGAIKTNSYQYANGTPFAGNYGNANVNAFLPTYSGSMQNVAAIITTGNITSNGGYFHGNGYYLTGISGGAGNYGNSNVQSFLSSGAVNNAVVNGTVTATTYLGDGSQLTGIPSSYTNANVATFLPTYGGILGNGAANVEANQVVAVGIQTTGNVGAGNISGANVISAITITATGNVYGNYIIGNGSQLSGLPTSYTNANVTALLSSGNVTTDIITTGNVLSQSAISTTGNVLAQGLVSATGNIVTDGVFIGTFQGNVTGNFVVPGANTQVIFNTNGNADATGGMTYNKDSNTFIVLGTVSAQGNIIGGNIVGNALYLTNIPAGNLTGAVPVANTAITANTVTTNAQPNITSVGTLTTLTVSGNVTANTITTSGTGGDIAGANLIATVSLSASGNVTVGNLQLTASSSPTSSSPGVVGQLAWDTNYIYVCIAPNTWARSALTSGY